MIRLCAEAGLPEPEFRSDGERFVAVVWRDWLTDAAMAGLGLNERQRRVVALARQHGRVTNRDVKKATGITDRTVLRDFDDLIAKGILKRVGTVGRSAFYVLGRETRHKPDNPDMPETRHKPDKPANRRLGKKG